MQKVYCFFSANLCRILSWFFTQPLRKWLRADNEACNTGLLTIQVVGISSHGLAFTVLTLICVPDYFLFFFWFILKLWFWQKLVLARGHIDLTSKSLGLLIHLRSFHFYLRCNKKISRSLNILILAYPTGASYDDSRVDIFFCKF